ncbi:hypothetical protein EMCRGX_G031882 [Ephydatia muelleri]|eukprot:Em0018g128a
MIRVALVASLLALACARKLSTSGSLSFLALGDWGGQPSSPYYTTAEKDIAAAMGKTAQNVGSQFTIALGDNFYDMGVTNVNDPRFKETFENVFTASALQSRWYALCGNHDHYGNASAEVAYTQLSKRWYMPNFYYTETMTIPGTTTTVQFIFIDTVILCGATHPTKRSLPPPGPQSHTMADDEWAWINDTLATSTADWILMFGHYPVWSVAEHGPTQQLVDQLRPLLMQYGVTGYFCGHDHSLQYINDTNVNYFVCGAGHLTDDSESHVQDIPRDSLKYRYAPLDPLDQHGGYASVTLTPLTMDVTYYDASGSELFTTTVPNSRKQG